MEGISFINLVFWLHNVYKDSDEKKCCIGDLTHSQEIMNNKKILITGGAGFVGSNLALQFKKKYPSYSLICVDNLQRKGSELNVPRLRKASVEFVKGDVRDVRAFEKFPQADVVIDCAADPSILGGITSPSLPMIQTNLMGTVHLLEYAKKCGAALVFLSTSRVYPMALLRKIALVEKEERFVIAKKQELAGVSEEGVSESFSLEGSRTLYGATKLCSEHLIEEYHASYGVKSVVNRFGVIAGPWQMGSVEQGFFALWVARHFYGGSLRYIGYGGKQVRDVLHVDDVFALVDIQVHDVERFNGRCFNAGGGRENSVSLLELTAWCEKITGKTISLTHAEGREIDVPVYVTDYSLLHNFCGWKPKRDVRKIVEDVLQWLREHPEVKKIIG